MSAEREDHQELRARLARAEAVIEALRNREVDVILSRDDVTFLRLRETEEALRRSEARYRAIVEDQTELICRCSPDLELTFANTAYRRYFKLPAELQPGTSFLDGVHAVDRQHVELGLRGLSEQHTVDGESHRSTRLATSGDGTRHVEWTHRAVMGKDGELMEIQSVGRDVTERVQAENALAAMNESLERKVVERTKRLRMLAERLSTVETREREHLAQVLHDTVQQVLAGARIQVSLLDKQGLSERNTRILNTLDQLIGDALQQSRTLAAEISPAAVKRFGLAGSLKWVAERFESQNLRLSVTVDQNIDAVQGEDLQYFLVSAVRELLFNVVKHAESRTAELRATSSSSGVLIVVQDAGVGFDPAVLPDVSSGIGLFSIRERSRLYGVSVSVERAPGAGTRVTLCVPPSPNTVAGTDGSAFPTPPAGSNHL